MLDSCAFDYFFRLSNHPDFVEIIPRLLENLESQPICRHDRKNPDLISASRKKKPRRYFRQILLVQISFRDPVKNGVNSTKWTKWTGHKLDWLPFNKSVIPDLSNFILMNMSQSKEVRYFVFHYSSIFYKQKKRCRITINLRIIFDENYLLGLLEMVLQDIMTPDPPSKIPTERGP